MRLLVVLLSTFALHALGAETFSFEMPEPRLRIVIPDIPQMKMQPHPLAASQPHARFQGSSGDGYSLALLLPSADPGMTPRDCARALARHVINRFGLDPRYVVGVQASESTYVMLFPYRADAVLQFKAFLLSASNGTHCVEVHVSRTLAPAPEKEMAESLAQWFEGFRGARIEPY